jgi:NADH-quinone oxidoreductase subunit C
MSLTNDKVKELLIAKFGDLITEWEEPYGMLTFRVPAMMNIRVMQYLFDSEALGFRFMTDLTAVHYPDRKDEELAVVYHLHKLADGLRIRIKVYVPVEKPDVPTMTNLFSTANWLEREAYDFFGVNFVGHPNLIRIMNVDEMDYFPMRKEYQMEDPTRRDKDDEMFGRG